MWKLQYLLVNTADLNSTCKRYQALRDLRTERLGLGLELDRRCLVPHEGELQ